MIKQQRQIDFRKQTYTRVYLYKRVIVNGAAWMYTAVGEDSRWTHTGELEADPNDQKSAVKELEKLLPFQQMMECADPATMM